MLYELQNGPVHYDHDRLSNLLFNPLTSNLDCYLIRSEDIYPDAHVNINSRCDYYVDDKFNEILQSETVISPFFTSTLEVFKINKMI